MTKRGDQTSRSRRSVWILTIAWVLTALILVCLGTSDESHRLAPKTPLAGIVAIIVVVPTLLVSWLVDDLRRAHAETELLLASISSILIGVDGKGLITRWNRTAEETFGIPASEALGRPFARCRIQWHDGGVPERIEQCRGEGCAKHLEGLMFQDAEGRDRSLSVTIHPVKTSDSAEVGFLLLGADLTERKIMEVQLGQAQKLKAVGLLAAGIAHEINTPMQYVGDNTYYLEKGFGRIVQVLEKYQAVAAAAKSGTLTAEAVAEAEAAAQEARIESLLEEIPEAIRDSQEGVQSVARIVRAMKEFSHPGTDEKTPTDVNRTIESTIAVARNEWKYIADVETDFDLALPAVPALPGELSQVFLNLLVNAAHAIEEVVVEGSNGKGLITLSTRVNGDWAEIRVSDTGVGIPEEIRSRLFEPFFTTKEVGKGTGQGLAIAHSVVVQKHGGKIWFETEVGKGTTFIVWLPLESETEVETSNATLAEAEVFGGQLAAE